MILQYGTPVGMQVISLKVNTSVYLCSCQIVLYYTTGNLNAVLARLSYLPVFLSLAESFWKGFELDQREHLTSNISGYHPCLYHQPPILSANVFLWGVRF